ncbi:MAG: AAA-like domain-containing protein, partial [Thermoleophilaceae bacterium]
MAAENPFVFSGPLDSEQMVDRDREANELATLAAGGHWARLEAPRRYGKTTLLRRVLAEVEQSGMASALVDLEGVLSLGGIVIRIERAYSRSLKGKARQTVDRLFRSWDLGLSLGAAGFAVELRANPRLDAESVLLRLLELPEEVHARTT